MQHRGLKLYNVYINNDPGLTLTHFRPRIQFGLYEFEWDTLLQSHLMGKTLAANDRIGRRFMCLRNKIDHITADNQLNAKPVVKQRHPGDEFPVSQRGSTKSKVNKV